MMNDASAIQPITRLPGLYFTCLREPRLRLLVAADLRRDFFLLDFFFATVVLMQRLLVVVYERSYTTGMAARYHQNVFIDRRYQAAKNAKNTKKPDG